MPAWAVVASILINNGVLCVCNGTLKVPRKTCILPGLVVIILFMTAHSLTEYCTLSQYRTGNNYGLVHYMLVTVFPKAVQIDLCSFPPQWLQNCLGAKNQKVPPFRAWKIPLALGLDHLHMLGSNLFQAASICTEAVYFKQLGARFLSSVVVQIWVLIQGYFCF